MQKFCVCDVLFREKLDINLATDTILIMYIQAIGTLLCTSINRLTALSAPQ